MKTRSAYAVASFIKKNTTVKEFYDYITCDETDFNYDINDRGRAGSTVLKNACELQNIPLVNALLIMGANPNLANDGELTPLFEAIQSGNLETVKLLRQHGARLDSLDINYFDLAKNRHSLDILDYLTSTQTDFERETANKKRLRKAASLDHAYLIRSEFKRAIEANDVETAEKLLSDNNINLKQVCFNATDYATRFAATRGNMEMVKLLVKHGDFIIESDHLTGISTPQAAKNAGHSDIAEFLETTQRERYQRLKAEVTKQNEIIEIPQNTSYQPGLFHEKNNNHSESSNNQPSTNIQFHKTL